MFIIHGLQFSNKMSDQTGSVENKDSNRETPQSSDNREPRRGGRGGRNRNRGGNQNSTQNLSNDSSLNMSELREIADLFKEHGFTDFEFENENIRVRLRKETTPSAGFTQYAAPETVTPKPPQNAAPPQNTQTAVLPVQTAVEMPSVSDAKIITSPIVGTFYRSPSPEADPFVKIGSQVTMSSIVCIVEAMKLMNEIEAEISGEIVNIFVENGQPVEYGQPLFAVK